jgi:hypothetical protein
MPFAFFSLPPEVAHQVLIEAVLARTWVLYHGRVQFNRVLRLRLVSRAFTVAVDDAIVDSGAFSTAGLGRYYARAELFPRPVLWRRCVARILMTRPFLTENQTTLRQVAARIVRHRHLTLPTSPARDQPRGCFEVDLRRCIEEMDRLYYPKGIFGDFPEWLREEADAPHPPVDESTLDFNGKLLIAAAYLDDVDLISHLVTSYFGNPANE